MSQYLLSVHVPSDRSSEPMTEEQMRDGFDQIAALEGEMRAEGALVFSGRLTDASSATVVRPNGNDVTTTDGPYVEAKEVIGGFYVIEAPDLDAALGWASKTTAVINVPIEVRPFWEAPHQ